MHLQASFKKIILGHLQASFKQIILGQSLNIKLDHFYIICRIPWDWKEI